MSENKSNAPKLFLELIITEVSVLSTVIFTGLGLENLWEAYQGKIDYNKGAVELGIGILSGIITSYVFYHNIKRDKDF